MEAVVVSLRPFQGRPSRHREEEETPPAPFPASTTVAGKWSFSPPPFSFFLCHHPSEHCLVPLSPLRRHSASASSAALQPKSSPPPSNVPCSHHRFDPDNNDCTQAISDVIELMLNEPWLNYSKIPEDVQKRWFEKWAEGFTWPAAESKQIRKAFDYRVLVPMHNTQEGG
ncbi:hypothetical protein PIB30_103137 [Stylosanthes scabra]|uniref:Uncharacterized protein n=1 Tax=Stylosanthes scabra TaxID=79078 RepID=A0ABU6VWQ7_9FABA|nr:hypothetical protein [Stylosanthes scabra]